MTPFSRQKISDPVKSLENEKPSKIGRFFFDWEIHFLEGCMDVLDMYVFKQTGA